MRKNYLVNNLLKVVINSIFYIKHLQQHTKPHQKITNLSGLFPPTKTHTLKKKNSIYMTQC